MMIDPLEPRRLCSHAPVQHWSCPFTPDVGGVYHFRCEGERAITVGGANAMHHGVRLDAGVLEPVEVDYAAPVLVLQYRVGRGAWVTIPTPVLVP